MVVGVGPGNGAAIARAFAQQGDHVAGLARRAGFAAELAEELGGSAHVCDVSEVASIGATLDRILADRGTVDTVVFNAGPGRFSALDDLEVEHLENDWQINVRGCFAFGKRLLPLMAERGSGGFVAVGAGATFRGRANTLSFASAKAGQRIMLESFARAYGPKGVHVAYLILDGGVDSPTAREHFPDHPDDAFIQPAAVADAALFLTKQPRSAWSFEHLVRPSVETW